MTVLKTYMKLLVKNGFAVLPFFIVFMVLSVLFGQSTGGNSAKVFQAIQMDVIISASSENAQANDFSAWLESMDHNVTRKSLTDKEAREEIFLEYAQAVYLFPDTAEGHPVVLTDQKSGAGYYAVTLAETFYRYRDAYRLEDGSVERDSLFKTLSQEMKVEIDSPKEADGTEDGVNAIVGSMSGAVYVLMAVSLGVLPLINEAFTRPGVFERSISSPYKVRKSVFEMFLGSGIVVFASAVILFGISLITLHRYASAGHLGRIAVNYLVYALCVLALSSIVSNVTRNRGAISAISTVFSLGLSFISGAFVPQELVNESVLNVSKAFPLYYYIRANRNSLVWADMVPDILVQMVFLAVYVVIAVILQHFARRARKTIKTASSLVSDIGA